ncbi:unnamed protein product, partial [Polarella glacialis]
DSVSSPEDVELDVEGEGEDPVDESNFGFGPVSLHSKFVKCKVCGNQEKVDRVEFPTLRIRLSCRTSISPMSENVLRLLGGGATNSSSKGGGKGQSSQWQEKSRSKWSSSWESAWGGEYEEKPSKSNKVKSSASDSTYASSVPTSKEDDRQRLKMKDLMQKELFTLLKDNNFKNVPGPLLAGQFAARYNKHLRTDGKRNDGAVRKWIGAQPGIQVESMGGNKWCVHVDPAVCHGILAAKVEEKEATPAPAAAVTKETKSWTESKGVPEKQFAWKVKASKE